VFIQSLQTMFKSKLVTDQKLLKDVHEESLQIPKPNQSVPVQPSGRPFEGVWTPLSVQQFYDEDVWTSEQHRPDARSIIVQHEKGFRSQH
jgi:hypothetical protein